QIVTVHASKGLEYPVVFVPYLWSCKPRTKDELLGFHQGGEACLDAGSDAIDTHLPLAEQERLAEDVRLAYVALTRAESALYLVWGRAGSRPGHAGQTALGYLLHPGQHSRQLATELPAAFAGLASLDPDLKRLAESAGGDIAVEPLPQTAAGGLQRVPDTSLELAPRPFTGRIAADWRVSSFSALTRELHSGPAAPREEAADDLALRFPAGSHVGSYLHLLLERLDFQGDVAQQVLEHSAQIAPRFNLDHGRYGHDAAVLLERVVRTPLDPAGLHLAQVATGQRLNELEFDLATRTVDIVSLNGLLSETAGESLPPLQVETFQGMVTGVIDLVFVHDGLFYIADYKSNLLGGRFESYGEEGLRAAVHERRYDLQYLLYTLALHRYLGARLPGYDYGRQFGGVYYLFLRGMRPETGAGCGVYFRRPERSVVDRLDRQVFAWPMECAL
ncbi:MAG: exodeoxyribonuclease beta subunit, partial [Chromatiaceae bacterium]|nr:exodeoxyribonuclease beta subunit [Chromatiaceae bacterium]